MADKAVNITLRAKLEQFSKDLDNAARKLARTGKKFESIGKNMSVAFTLPLVAGAYKATQAFAEEELALNKLSSAVEANGKDVSSVIPEYQKWAAEIQKTTTIADDQVFGLLQLAESMKLANPEEAVKGAIGLSRAFGIDLESAMRAVAKGTNGQWMAVQRLIPTLKLAGTDSKKMAMFQKMMADGFLMAQKETNTFSGSMIQMKNAVGDAMEKLGAKLAPIITKIAVKVTEWAQKFNGLSDGAAKAILIIGGLVAAIGPILFIVGKVMAGFTSLIRVFSMLTSPIGLIIIGVAALAAAAVVLIKNWDTVKIFFQKVWINIENVFYKSIKAILVNLGKLTSIFWIDFTKTVDKLNTKISENNDKLKELTKAGKDIKEAKEAEKEASKANAAALLAESLIIDDQTNSLGNLNDELEKTTDLKEELKGFQLMDYFSLGGDPEKMMSTERLKGQGIMRGIASNPFKNLTKNIETSLSKLTKFQKTFNGLAKKIKVDVDILYNALAGVLTDAFNAMGNAIEQAITSNGQYTFQNFLDSLLKVVYDFMKAFGAQLTAIGVGNLALGNPAGAWQIAAGAALIAGGAAAAGLHQNAMAKREPSYNNGTQNLQLSLESTLQGRDLYLSNQRETNYRGRIR
jgi:hypothetical protein